MKNIKKKQTNAKVTLTLFLSKKEKTYFFLKYIKAIRIKIHKIKKEIGKISMKKKIITSKFNAKRESFLSIKSSIK
ncbi:MAG: hypothetical protein VXZ40_03495 [Nanoarchaeota archaeon]|nr:hypothetical protein [Nanoarchaeota archaeon]